MMGADHLTRWQSANTPVDIRFVLTIILAIVFVVSIDVEALTLIAQKRWFSFAGGVAIAYVFLDILPRLSQFQLDTQQDANILSNLEINFYILFLIGILIFYGLEKLARRSRNLNQATSKDYTRLPVALLHIAVFSAYGFILTWLLNGYRFDSLIIEQALFFVVLVLHFIVIDYYLSDYHKKAYRRGGRWILVSSIIFGSLVPTELFRDTIAGYFLWSFVAGSMVSNVLKDELSEKNESCFWSFCFGATIFSIVLLLLGYPALQWGDSFSFHS